MSAAFRSSPANVSIHDSGWLLLESGVEITKRPLHDLDTGGAARLGGGVSQDYLASRGLRLPTVAEYRELHAAALHIDPVTLPTSEMLRADGIPSEDAAINRYRNAHMMGLPWCKLHDDEVRQRLAHAGYDGTQAVANDGKHWALGDDGGPVLTGWWRSNGKPIQNASKFHRGEPTYVDYGTTFHAVRKRVEDTDPAPETESDPGDLYTEPPPDSMPRITKPGERGADVCAWQLWLMANGYELVFGSDGDHGDETERATKRYRAAQGDTVADPVIVSTPSNESQPPPSEPLFEFIESRNFTRAGRALESIDWLVLHSTENPIRNGTARNVARWFGGPSAPRASAHYVTGPDETIQCVRLADVSWAAPGANRSGVNLEIVGQAYKTNWLDDGNGDRDGLQTMLAAAGLVAFLCAKLDLPIERVTADGLRAGERGITTHAAVTEAFRKGTHTDPGGKGDKRWPWSEFLQAVRAHG